MPAKRAIFRILVQAKDTSTDDALFRAVQHSDPLTIRSIIETLLVRGQPRGLTAVVSAFHLLDPPTRQMVIEQADNLYSGLRTALQSRNERVRINVMELIRYGHAYRASYLLDPAFHDSSPHVREAAAHALYDLAEELMKKTPMVEECVDIHTLDEEQLRDRMMVLSSRLEDRAQVAGAIEAGLSCFGLHLQPRVVEAAMWYVDMLGQRFWALISAPGSRIAHTAIGIFNNAHNPRFVCFAMQGLKYGVLRPHILRALAKCHDPAFLAEWVRQSWRLVSLKNAKGMASVKENQLLNEGTQLLLQVGDENSRHVPHMLLTSGLSEKAKAGVFKDLHRRGDPVMQRAVVWNLVNWTQSESTSLLQSIARSEDVRLARMARFELARRRPREYPIAGLQSDHHFSKNVMDDNWSQPQLPRNFDEYWSAFEAMDDKQKRMAGQRIMGETPAGRAMLNRRLIESDRESRLKALKIVDLLNLAEQYEETLYRLARDGESVIRSNAIAQLGRFQTATGRQLLQEALDDEDYRVQANAIEALEAYGVLSLDDLMPKLASPDNRVRANAVKALLKVGTRDAAETLLHMLSDDNRAQRISALWLVEQMGLSSLAMRVMKLAENDEDEEVRKRAEVLLQHLQESSGEEVPVPGGSDKAAPAAQPLPAVVQEEDTW